MKVRAELFAKVNAFSGSINYYTTEPDGDGGRMIHAEYQPPEKTVKLGYRIPDAFTESKKVAWDWRIIVPPRGSAERNMKKNDSGASVYLVFHEGMQTLTIKYIYSESLPVGTTFPKDSPSPLQKMQIVVVNSLAGCRPGGWKHVEVDVPSDFKRFFKSKRCAPLRGIGILSDGDETLSPVVADYRNFIISAVE
jgi:hypothetical protein